MSPEKLIPGQEPRFIESLEMLPKVVREMLDEHPTIIYATDLTVESFLDERERNPEMQELPVIFGIEPEGCFGRTYPKAPLPLEERLKISEEILSLSNIDPEIPFVLFILPEGLGVTDYIPFAMPRGLQGKGVIHYPGPESIAKGMGAAYCNCD